MSKIKKNDKEVQVYDDEDRLIGYGGVSRSSPLSNFYESEFTYSGHKFNFSEVAIMWTKAETFGLRPAMKKCPKFCTKSLHKIQNSRNGCYRLELPF